jgi:release factor glutamine methyltransferase
MSEDPGAQGPGDAANLADATDLTDGTLTWRQLVVETNRRLGDGIEARWLCQEASGLEGVDWVLGLEDRATERAVARLDDMVARRLEGEPLQYVLGHWSFRTLDLLVDRRVLIPRPETEQLVEVALRVARATTGPLTIADLGTGSGAIAMALASELFPRPLTVWATDASEDALAVARANLAGLGRAAVTIRMEAGSWFDALPPDLAGHLDLVISNPPYIGTADHDLDERVRGWEPAAALLAGPDGLDALRDVIAGAPRWLAAGGSLLCEIGATQGTAVVALAESAGLTAARVEPDLAGHDRILVATRP